ncbi:sigma factor [Streptomyces glaucescens]|uniref:sigma factor n=1 Tax=Streptomyces glaucescens TaxID=1907 RepID=UPI003450D8A6
MTAYTALSADRFEADRTRLRSVAYRMLGSLAEAEDAVQEAWLRASRADVAEVGNVSGWLTTVVARVCLNMLRARRARPEEPFGHTVPDSRPDPEQEALLADSVGVALLVVLDRLAPAERLAFVLHDMFAVPFDDIAPLVERTPAATRQLASRARRRVRGTEEAPPPADLARQRTAVSAFLAATRAGDFEALVALLAPGVRLTADRWVVPTPEPITVTGARPVARGAMAAMSRARFTGPALVDGAVGLVMAVGGRLALVLAFTVTGDGITRVDIVADRARLAELSVAALGD